MTPEVRDILKILWKRGEIAPKEQFLLFSTIFCCLLEDLRVKTGTSFSLRDKRLFEISEVEITRVDCTYDHKLHDNNQHDFVAIIATANDPQISKSASTAIKNFSFSFEKQTLTEKFVTLLGPFQKAIESVI